jgi:hypothetical protein
LAATACGGLFIPTYTKKAMVATTPRTRKMIDPMIRPDYLDMNISEWINL